jgi:hypothetical protein
MQHDYDVVAIEVEGWDKDEPANDGRSDRRSGGGLLVGRVRVEDKI